MSLKETAAAVLRLIEAGEYEANGTTVCFRRQQDQAVKGTQLVTPEQLASYEATAGHLPKVQVVEGTTQVVAQSMSATSDAPLALLNFASARNPGGGFLNGAKAQEEDLCRCSGLYPCLLQCPQYYEVNRQQPSLLYTDYAIFSPRVPFFKVRGTGDLLSSPFFVSVITAPAPNSGPFLREHPEAVEQLRETFVRRWGNVLRIARAQGIQRLLLGAWGCGAFGGDPVMASQTAHQAIQTVGQGIDEIVFAIPGSGPQSRRNLEAFKLTFS